MLKKLTLEQISIPIIFVVSLIVILIWFRDGQIMGGAEEGLSFYDPYRTLWLAKSMWWGNYNGGFGNLSSLSFIPSITPAAILYKYLLIPNFIAQAITF